jgi:hypothetical protein
MPQLDDVGHSLLAGAPNSVPAALLSMMFERSVPDFIDWEPVYSTATDAVLTGLAAPSEP